MWKAVYQYLLLNKGTKEYYLKSLGNLYPVGVKFQLVTMVNYYCPF